MVLLSDGHLTIGEDTSTRSARFFSLGQRLPMDLQMVLCNRLFDLPHDFVTVSKTTIGFKQLVKTY